MIDVRNVALAAEVIVGGFAIVRLSDAFRVVNLNNARGVAVMRGGGLVPIQHRGLLPRVLICSAASWVSSAVSYGSLHWPILGHR